MEVFVVTGIIIFICFILWIANRNSGNNNSLSDDNNTTETTQYQNNSQLQQTQEVPQTNESQPPLPSQWICADENDSFYIAISLTDGSYCGPITLAELRSFELMPDYMVTTDKLGGNWYPAGCFFCLADLFYENINSSPKEGQDFIINEDGTITKLKKKKK